IFFLLITRHPTSTLFPYTTLFRSHVAILAVVREAEGQGIGRALLQAGEDWARANRYSKLTLAVFKDNERAKQVYERQGWRSELRSEEHTSELQSLAYLVCRLLLEK